MRHNKRTNGTIFDCIYIRNCHNYVSGCGMRVPGNIDYWRYCPFCSCPLIGGKENTPANWFRKCRYTFKNDKYKSECEPDLNIYDFKNWKYCPFCAKRIIDLSREGNRYE